MMGKGATPASNLAEVSGDLVLLHCRASPSPTLRLRLSLEFPFFCRASSRGDSHSRSRRQQPLQKRFLPLRHITVPGLMGSWPLEAITRSVKVCRALPGP